MAKREGYNSLTVGIDFGTCYSHVAIWSKNWVDVIADEQGSRAIPSCITFTEDERLIGSDAKDKATMNPTNTVFSIKRLIGTRRRRRIDAQQWPFEVLAGPDGRPIIVVQHKGVEKQFAAEEIASMLLMKLRDIAEAHLGSTVKNVMIAVPAGFNSFMRQAIKDAGRIAGLNVVRLVSESVAASLHFLIKKRGKLCGTVNVLVVDIGGGKCDVSLVNILEGVIEVKSSVGDTELGGEDFDDTLVDYFVRLFKKKHGKDISGNHRKLRKLRIACEKAKRTLSVANQVTIEFDFLFEEFDIYETIKRAKFEELNLDLFLKCVQVVSVCLKEAKIEKYDVDELVLVGASTRIPKLQELLREYLNGKEICEGINPDEAVAQGAAVYAAIFDRHENECIRDLLLLDVNPCSVGVETKGGAMAVLIPKNTLIPTQKEKVFTTDTSDYSSQPCALVAKDDREYNTSSRGDRQKKSHQSNILIEVYEGESPSTTDNRLIGKISVSDAGLGPGGKPEISICFSVDADGILDVQAKDMITGRKHKMTVTEEEARWSKGIDKMVRRAEKYRYEDQEHKNKVDAKNALENFAYNLKEAIKKIEDQVEQTFSWLEANQSAKAVKFQEKMENLRSICSNLIANT